MPIDISRLAQLGQSIEERQSEGYIDFMTNVWLALEERLDHLLRIGENAIDLSDLLMKKGNLIWFAVEEGGIEHQLPFDFEFSTELDQDILKHIVSSMEPGYNRLHLSNKSIFKNLKNKSKAKTAEYKLDNLNIFKDLSDIIQKIQKAISTSEKYKGGPAALNKLHKSFEIPNRTHFRLLLVKKILDDNQHPLFDESTYHLKNSYFKGRTDAFNQSLNMMFLRLNRGADMIASKADEFTRNHLQKKVKWSKNSLRPWYNYNFDNDENRYLSKFNKDTLFWMDLQRCQFKTIKKYWGADRFRDQLRKLVNGGNTQTSASAITRLVWQVQSKIHSSCLYNGEVFVAMNMERHFNFQDQKQFEIARQWVWDNRLYLMEILEKALRELRNRRMDNPNIVFSREIDQLLTVAEKQLELSDRRALDHYNSLISSIDLEELQTMLKKQKRLNETMAFFNMLCLINKKIKTISVNNLEWFAKMQAAFPIWTDMERALQTIYQTRDALESLRNEVGIKIIECFELGAINFSTLTRKHKELFIHIWRNEVRKRLSQHDFDIISDNYYEDLLEKALGKTRQEQLAHFAILLEMVERLPSQNGVLEGLRSWQKDMKGEQLELLKEGVEYVQKTYSKTLETVPTLIREHLCQALLQSEEEEEETTQIRLEAFGLWTFSAEYLERNMTKLIHEVDKIAAIRDGQQIAVEFSDLRQAILEAQDFFIPEQNSMKELDSAFWLLETEERRTHLTDKILPISARLKSRIFRDLVENFENLKALKEKADQELYLLRKEQTRFGFSEDFSHLQTSLNIDELKEIRSEFSLRADCQPDDLQRFASLISFRRDKYTTLLEEMQECSETNYDNASKVVIETKNDFSRKYYIDFKENTWLDPKFRLAILYHDPGSLEIEANYLARFLNYTRPSTLIEQKTFKLYMNIFRLISIPNKTTRTRLRRLWGQLDIRLKKFEPKNQLNNYKFNREIFFKEAKKIVKNKLD